MSTQQIIMETKLGSLASQQLRLQESLADGEIKSHEYLALIQPVLKRILEIDPSRMEYKKIYNEMRFGCRSSI
jgi:hypothetical protein